ncbi:MAG: hypothetical protein ACTSQ9_06045 [Candidatus Hodarchaeales archaeon]
MIDWNYLIDQSITPLFFLILPFFLSLYQITRSNRKLNLNKPLVGKFVLISGLLSLLIFTALIFLTGGINSYYRLQEGIFIDARSFTWNLTNHLKIYIPFDPGISLLAVSLLSGSVYGGLIVTKPYCRINYLTTTPDSSTKRTSAVSSTSTAIAGASALASGVVCCSTSIIAFITPGFASFLAPIAPWLIIISFISLNLTFMKYVFPRFPTKGKNEINESIITFEE